ncbi:MAG: hypothetical protein ABIA47_02050 [bacterium]
MRFSNFFMILVALLALTTGCDDAAVGVCYEGGKVVFCGGYDGSDNGYGGAYEGDDVVVIEWAPRYDGQSSAQVTCVFDTDAGDITQVGETHSSGGYYEFVFYDVPSHFDADCTGVIDYGSGPQQPMFCDESSQGEVTLVTWENEAVQNFWARNCELDINNS